MTVVTEMPVSSDSRELARLRRSNRYLTIAVAVLAVVLVGLGAWLVYDMTATPDAGASPEVEALLDDYTTAWNEGDVDAFMNAVSDNYQFSLDGVPGYRTAETVAGELSTDGEWQITILGEPLMIGDGPQYYVVFANEISDGDSSDTYGISQLTVFERGDGLEIVKHVWVER